MNPTPWYKNFWPWFLMFFPFVSIVGCFLLVYVAIGNGPDLVVDDYYKKGKAINLELSKFDKAKALFLHGDIEVSEHRVAFNFTKGDYSKVTAIKASFYHRTISKHDFSATLLLNGEGHYTATLDSFELGAYTVFLEPMDSSWKLKENLELPTKQPIAIKPEYK